MEACRQVKSRFGLDVCKNLFLSTRNGKKLYLVVMPAACVGRAGKGQYRRRQKNSEKLPYVRRVYRFCGVFYPFPDVKLSRHRNNRRRENSAFTETAVYEPAMDGYGHGFCRKITRGQTAFLSIVLTPLGRSFQAVTHS